MTNDCLPLGDGARIIEIPRSETIRILDLLEKAFPDVSRTFFYSILANDPWGKTGKIYAVEKNKRLASTLQVFDRTMILGGAPYRFGGIGGVGTDPKHQGFGYSSALLRHAIGAMERAGVCGLLLFTKIQPFYERLGWRTIRQTEWELSLADVKTLARAAVSYRPIAAGDYDLLQSWHERCGMENDGRVSRTAAYWKARSTWMNHTGMMALRDGEPAAYFYAAKFRDNQPVMTVSEYGFANASDETIQSFWAAAARMAEEKHCKIIRGFFAQHNELSKHLRKNNVLDKNHEHNYIMWRDLPGHSCFELIQESVRQNRFVYWQTDAF